MSQPAGTIECRACGGGVPDTAASCPYCGAKVIVPTVAAAAGTPPEPRTYCPQCAQFHPSSLPGCPRCPPTSPDARGGRCPRCKTELDTRSNGGVLLDACTTCRGLWFDGGEIRRVLDLATKGAPRDEVEALRSGLPWHPSPIEKGTLDCVRCRTPMTRRQIATRSGVVVDVCPSHGIWFDGGEWEQFQEFVRAGGLEVLRRDREAPRAKGLRGWSGPMSRRTYFPGDESPWSVMDLVALIAGMWS